MKKLVAAVLTGVLVAGTLSTGVYAKDDDKTITVAASATPHAEILEEAKPLLEKEGYELEVTVFDDYVRPNEVVESGEFDANYFQHIPYLDQFNEEKGTHLVNAGGIHYEPFTCDPMTITGKQMGETDTETSHIISGSVVRVRTMAARWRPLSIRGIADNNLDVETSSRGK